MENLEVKAERYCPIDKTELVASGPVTGQGNTYVIFAYCKKPGCIHYEYLDLTKKELEKLREKSRKV